MKSNLHCMITHENGFSLIELLVTIVILAILGTIAVTVYTDQIVKTRRTDGTAALLDVMAQQERYYSLNNTYTVTLSALPATVDGDGKVDSEEGFYKISAAACGAGIGSCVILTAEAQGTQDTDDSVCGDLTYNSLNQKGEGGTGTVDDCW